jgi:hypothetical protein
MSNNKRPSDLHLTNGAAVAQFRMGLHLHVNPRIADLMELRPFLSKERLYVARNSGPNLILVLLGQHRYSDGKVSFARVRVFFM